MRRCWQIRLDSIGKATDVPSSAWRLDCAECSIQNSGVACWEQCEGTVCCCAPIHISCDFCVLYIEHRREVSSLMQAKGELTPIEIARLREPSEGGRSVTMEKLQLNIPDMYADHHVLKVRAALTVLNGVQDVIASSSFRMVAMKYDPALTTPEAIGARLAEAGYPVATEKADVLAHLVPVQYGHADPAWDRLGVRVSSTDERDARIVR